MEYARWMPCPSRTVFDPNEHKCDYPSVYNCTPHPDAPCSTTVVPPSTWHTPSTASTASTAATTASKKATAEETDDDTRCHVDCSKGFYLKANPRDCHSYFSCAGGIAVKMPCPEGLVWNEAAKRCDWPNLANCEVTCGHKDVEAEDLPWCDPPVCKSPYGLMPNPGNCSSFYNCNYWNPVRMVCPPDLEYADAKKECDYPADAHCVQTCKEKPSEH